MTVPYAAPELAAAREAGARSVRADPAADVWALGVIGYELLSGTRAFPPAVADAEVLASLAGRAPLPWEGLPPDARLMRRRRLGRCVLCCLERDAAKRPTIDEVVGMWDSVFQLGSSTSGASGSAAPTVANAAGAGGSGSGPRGSGSGPRGSGSASGHAWSSGADDDAAATAEQRTAYWMLRTENVEL
jgi:serine/threonine protein kinase